MDPDGSSGRHRSQGTNNAVNYKLKNKSQPFYGCSFTENQYLFVS
jgi:hypothetical protein